MFQSCFNAPKKYKKKPRTTTDDTNLQKKVIGKPREKKIDVLDPYWRTDDDERQRYDLDRNPIIDEKPATMPSNECYKLDTGPTPTQALNYNGPTLAPHEPLQYNCFIPTGEIYEFRPCAPYTEANGILGFKRHRGVDTIMARYGDFMPGTTPFKPYKLLIYRGRVNDQPDQDDGHRFVYLAQSKAAGEGDCFIRLEEVHNRMKGNSNPYIEDCRVAIELATQLKLARRAITHEQRKNAQDRYGELVRDRGGLLRFRCWAVEGVISAAHENKLATKLFGTIFAETENDHVEVFRLWAEILRKSQGDKLASKDFFGRYWDAVIPNETRPAFHDGMKILVSVKFLQDRGFSALNQPSAEDRTLIKGHVHQAVLRVINAPRLKFKPALPLESIIFPDELQGLPDGWQGLPQDNRYRNLADNGWRTLEAHPGGLYSILINRAVRDFFCSEALNKQLWQGGYSVPDQGDAETLHVRLDKCGKTEDTVTEVWTKNVAAAKNGKRKPTQDKCVANVACSANIAMSKVYPGIYPDSSEAKRRRVAEWLHRSAFSYGGLTPGDLNSSQVANNLVLGSPETNTVMMRYEAFIKRLAFYSNNRQGDRVVVVTRINYPNLVGWNQNWVGDEHHRYTWLAPELSYIYENSPNSVPLVSFTRPLYPMQRENSMLFESLLDKSLEALCWDWGCWDTNNAVAEALVESTGVDGDQAQVNQDDLADMLQQELNQRDQELNRAR